MWPFKKKWKYEERLNFVRANFDKIRMRKADGFYQLGEQRYCYYELEDRTIVSLIYYDDEGWDLDGIF